MPIYEYQCERCGTFEVNQRITASPLRRCPDCRSKVRKLISQTSFQLKGSGWYVTDYASGDKDKKKKKEEPKAAESPKSESGGTKESAGKKSEASAA